MYRKLDKLLNVSLIVLTVALLVKKGPEIIFENRIKGSTTPQFVVPTLTGSLYNIHAQQNPQVLIFWATWCGPCQFELSRINRLITKKQIDGNAVLAIAVQEDLQTVIKTSKDRNYRFQVAVDPKGQLANLYRVVGTPTILFIDRQRKITWRTSGLSPTLGFRIANFLKQ